MKIIDISPVVSETTAVWPGDTPLNREILLSLSAGNNIDLSTFHGTVHIGAHADAPSHFINGGSSIESVALEPYIGTCYVHSVRGKKLITAQDCELPLSMGVKRVLFKTDSYPNPDSFNRDFCAISPQALNLLGESGIVLVGIDTPSVDPFESKSLDAHQALHTHGIRNLEGLVLSHVDDGLYELIALPLRIKGFDASPVRAVLRTSDAV